MKPKELSHDYGVSGTWPPQVLNLSHLLPKSACLATAPTISNSFQSSQASSIHKSAYRMFVQFSCHVPAVAETPILHTSRFAEQVQRTHLWGQELPVLQLQWVTWGSTSVVDDWQSLMKPLRGQQGFDATVFPLSLQWLSSLIQDHSQLELQSSLTTSAGLPPCISPDPHGLPASLCQLVTVAAARKVT